MDEATILGSENPEQYGRGPVWRDALRVQVQASAMLRLGNGEADAVDAMLRDWLVRRLLRNEDIPETPRLTSVVCGIRRRMGGYAAAPHR